MIIQHPLNNCIFSVKVRQIYLFKEQTAVSGFDDFELCMGHFKVKQRTNITK